VVAVVLIAIVTVLAWIWIVQPPPQSRPLRLRETLAEPHTFQIHANFNPQRVTDVVPDSPLWQPLHEMLPQVRLWNVWQLEHGETTVYVGRYVDYVIFEFKGRRRTVSLCLCSDKHVDLWIEEGPSTWHYMGSIAPEEVARIRRILPKEMTVPPDF
jgi:hypothetical protein